VTGRHPVLDGETAEILQQSALLTASFTPVVNLNSIHRVRQNYSHINHLFQSLTPYVRFVVNFSWKNVKYQKKVTKK
jgi:hypothetical protein